MNPNHKVSERTRPYVAALKRLSARTGTPLSSLAVSFGILHEVTALVPLVGVFFGARALGAGDRVVESLRANEAAWVTQWLDEGEAWAGRVGRRYGVFGYTKGDTSTRLAGDVANAVVAYGAVKAMLPLRIGLSLWLSPAFSRRCVEPVRSRIVQLWKRDDTRS